MSSDKVKNVGVGIIIASVILGVILGAVVKNPLTDKFNLAYMLTLWISGGLTGFFFLVLGTLIENQEYTNQYLLILAELKEKEMGEDTDKNKDKPNPTPTRISSVKTGTTWRCDECDSSNPSTSIFCKDCGQSR